MCVGGVSREGETKGRRERAGGIERTRKSGREEGGRKRKHERDLAWISDSELTSSEPCPSKPLLIFF